MANPNKAVEDQEDFANAPNDLNDYVDNTADNTADDAVTSSSASSEWDDHNHQANDYQDQEYENENVTHHVDEAEDEEVDRVKSMKKEGISPLKFTIMTALGILAVGGLGVGYMMATGEKPVEPQVSMPIAKPMAVAPVAPAPLPEPGGYDPATDPAYQSPAAAPVAQDPASQNSAVSTPVDTTLSPYGAAQHTGTAQVAPTTPNTTPVAVSPAPVNAATPAPATYQGQYQAPASPQTAAGTITRPVAPATAPVAAAVSAQVVAPAAMQPSSLSQLEVTQDARIAALEAKIAELQDMINKLTDAKAQAKPQVQIQAKPVVRPTPVVRRAPVIAEPKPVKAKAEVAVKIAKDPVFVSATASTPVHTPAGLTATEYAVPTAPAFTPAKSSARPYIVAIVPGRAFLQNSEGVRSDIAVGDQVANCGTVTKVDADAAEVVTERCIIR